MTRVITATDPDLGNQMVPYQSKEIVYAIGPLGDVEVEGVYHPPDQPVYIIVRNALDNHEDILLEAIPANDFQLLFAQPGGQVDPPVLVQTRYGVVFGRGHTDDSLYTPPNVFRPAYVRST